MAKAGAALERPDTTADALPYLEEALRVLGPAGPTKPLAGCLRSLAIAHYFDRDFETARSLLGQSEATAKAVGDLRGVATVQIAAAELAFAAGTTDEAIAEINTMLAGHHCTRRQTVLGLTNLAAYLLACDRLAEAGLVARQALVDARALDWRAAIVRVVEHIGLIAALGDDAETAARMLGHTAAFYATGTVSREHTEIATFERLSNRLTHALAPDHLAQLMREGAQWPSDEAAQQAMTVVAADPTAPAVPDVAPAWRGAAAL